MKLNLVISALLVFGSTVIFAQKEEVQDNSYAPNPNNKPKAKPDKPDYDLPDPVPFANTINAADVKKLVYVLASDSLQGRETGTEGQRKAAAFLANCLQESGIPPSGDRGTYEQAVHLERVSWKNIGITVDEVPFKSREDFYVYPSITTSVPSEKYKEVLFMGYGIDDPKYSDYGKNDVEGKVLLFYDGEPMDASGNYLITGNSYHSDWSLNWKKKIELAKSKGAAMVFIIDPALKENLKKNRKLISTYSWTPVEKKDPSKMNKMVNTAFISEDMAKAIWGSKSDKVNDYLSEIKNGKSVKPIKIKNKIEVNLDKELTQLEGSNVIGYIEGSDPELKKELVIVTAHYDHLGFVDDRIYYGADDNGSGSTGLMEIARAFAEAKKKGVGPKRSVLCMWVSGEEKGLLGSRYYVDFPLFPLKKTVVDINIDMIGRIDDEHKDGNYVYVIGSDRLSSELHEIHARNNRVYTKLELDYKYNDPKDPNHYYERSDHYNFAERGIPAIFFFNGTHADYHKATDTPDKIDCEALAKRAQLAFYTAWEIANRPTPLVVDKK